MKLRNRATIAATIIVLTTNCISAFKSKKPDESLIRTDGNQPKLVLTTRCLEISSSALDDTLALAQMIGSDIELAKESEREGAYVSAGYFYAKLNMEKDAIRMIDKLREHRDIEGARFVFFTLNPCAVTVFQYD